jgi:S-formylglutathione hydrolase FrmB
VLQKHKRRPEVPISKHLKGRVVLFELDSRLLKNNPLGDAPLRSHIVYLPPGYDDTDGDYPVVYCLAGFTGTSWSFVGYDAFTPNMPARFERLVEEAECPPAILVMVDGMTAVGGNQYINSAAVGRWADHIVHELVPAIDEEFRTLGDGHRGIMGKSSGGYGAIMHGLLYPAVWSAVACHSGDMYFQYCYVPDVPGAVDGTRGHADVEAWLRAVREKPKRNDKDNQALNIVAMSAFYSPSPSAPMGIDLPFEWESGRYRPEVFERWLEHDPVRLLESNADNLRGLKSLYVDCGSKDQFNLHLGARILTSRLRELGIEHRYEEFEDNHSNIQYRYDVSLPLLCQALTP